MCRPRIYDFCRSARQETLTTAVAKKISRTSATEKFVLANPHATEYIYLGTTNAVTHTSGFPLAPGESQEFMLSPTQDIYAYQASGGNVLIGVLEF